MENNRSKSVPALTSGQLEALCKTLADTFSGLTGSEIGHILNQIRVADISPIMTKWKRLYNALVERQNRDQSGDRVFAFIARAMEPARYAGQIDFFEQRVQEINVTLSYLGYEFHEDGKFHRCKQAKTLSEAEERANRMRSLLIKRNIHPDVIKFCRAELMKNNCFHAVLEACKSVTAKIRDRTGLTSDGAQLIQEAFGGNSPLLRVNSFSSESEKGEQRGFMNLAIGLFGTFRNPTAHEARIRWPLNEEDALDLFALASYVHRRIERI
ncbi:MAG: TIGR02391 family protein [Actinobacteria bacterium]|nr:TIGR02391 family protein [Actinomycetota bacterium]